MPDRRQQVILADDPIAVAYQANQEIEHLRLDSHKRASSTQFAPICVEGAVFEKIAHVCILLIVAAAHRRNIRHPKEK